MSPSRFSKSVALAPFWLALISGVPAFHAQAGGPSAPFPDAAASDPEKLGWMKDSPPPS